MSKQTLATLDLANFACVALEFLPPCQVRPMAERANAAYEASGHPELKLCDDEISRRQRMAQMRQDTLKGGKLFASTADLARQAVERARESVRERRAGQ